MVRGIGVLIIMLAMAPLAAAVEKEQREFVVFVDGKEAGQTTLEITKQDDGLVYVTSRVSVKFRQFLLEYSLSIDVAEWWRNDQVAGIKCQAVENGKRTEVTVALEGKELKARVNGIVRPANSEMWTSSFWKLPDAKYHNKAVPVFEVDTGKEYQGQLQFVGKEQLTLINRPQECYHFRCTGGPSPVDIWFDQHHRLVRQEFVDMGHKTIVQLVKVRR